MIFMVRYLLIWTCLLLVVCGAFAADRLPDGDESRYHLTASRPLMADQIVKPAPSTSGVQSSAMETRRIVPFRAFIQSMVIPGWGQRYVGKGTTIGTINFVTEVALWSTVAGFHAYGHWKEDEYKTLAATHAGVDNRGKDHQYYVDIGNYQNLDLYNEQQRRDRDFDELYLSSSDWWEWDSNDNRLQFKSIRIQSDNALNSRYYVLGAVFLNHLFSAIHASRQAVKLERSRSNAYNAPQTIQVTPEVGLGTIGLRLTGHF